MSFNLADWFAGFFPEYTFTKKGIFDALRKSATMYYGTDEDILSDAEYDRLAAYYESKFGKLPVGAAVAIGSTLDLSHSYTDFAGTLSKCKTIDDVVEWMRLKGIPADTNALGVSLKGDGHSITVELKAKKNGMVIDKALTRGEDGKGKDLTQLFKDNAHKVSIPDFVDFDCAIGFEAVVTHADFKRFTEIHGAIYKNPRSILGGIISEKGKEFFGEYVTLLPIRIKAADPENEVDRLLFLDWANEQEKNLAFTCDCTLDDIKDIYTALEEDRIESDEFAEFLCDGLVIETLDPAMRKKLGFSSTEPNFATALKFTPITKRTKVIDVKWSSEGHGGTHTPVVHFEPVVIRGNTYKQVSIANYARFKAMHLRVGDEVEFALRNDTLGYIEKVDSEFNDNNTTSKLFRAPTRCTVCNEMLHTDSVFLVCVNNSCKLNVVGNLVCFIEKTGVKNIGREMIKKLVEEELVMSITDLLFDLDYKAVAKLDGFGKTSAANIKKELDKVFLEPIKDFNLIGSLNIPIVGRGRAKLIFEKISFTDIYEELDKHGCLSAKTLKLITKIPGIGDEIAESFHNGLQEHYETLGELIANDVDILNSYTVREEGFVQLSFCHTGGAAPLKDRKAIKELIESKGHKLVGGVTKNTNYLINNDKLSTTSKNKDAKDLNVDIVSVEEMIELLG